MITEFLDELFNSIQFNLYLYSAIITPRKVHKALSIKYIKRQQYIKNCKINYPFKRSDNSSQ